MPRTVVTAGKDYLDIDAYGGIVAYAELLRATGLDAIAVSTAPFNSSVTPSLARLSTALSRTYVAKSDDAFVVVDLSDPEFFDTFVKNERVIGIVDHHTGFEEYWQTRLADGAHIEFIGAACTLVTELWLQAQVFPRMSKESAMLLAAGIIDNTLNFKATLTTERDRTAFLTLKAQVGLPDNWEDEYLADCQAQLMLDFSTGLASDTKQIVYPGLDYEIAIGQIAVLDALKLIEKYKELISAQLSKVSAAWYLNVLCLEDGKSYLFTTDPRVQKLLASTLGVTFEQDLAVADRLWLRKEIYKRMADEKNRPN